MSYSLFLDDERFPANSFPPHGEGHIVRSYQEAVLFVKENGMPSYITFDHDLGTELTGYDFAKFLVEEDLNGNSLPPNFSFAIHSANPVGANNITELLNSYLKFKGKP